MTGISCKALAFETGGQGRVKGLWGKNMAATMNSKKPVVDCGSQVKREDVKVKKEIKELPPQKIKTFR